MFNSYEDSIRYRNETGYGPEETGYDVFDETINKDNSRSRKVASSAEIWVRNNMNVKRHLASITLDAVKFMINNNFSFREKLCDLYIKNDLNGLDDFIKKVKILYSIELINKSNIDEDLKKDTNNILLISDEEIIDTILYRIVYFPINRNFIYDYMSNIKNIEIVDDIYDSNVSIMYLIYLINNDNNINDIMKNQYISDIILNKQNKISEIINNYRSVESDLIEIVGYNTNKMSAISIIVLFLVLLALFLSKHTNLDINLLDSCVNDKYIESVLSGSDLISNSDFKSNTDFSLASNDLKIDDLNYSFPVLGDHISIPDGTIIVSSTGDKPIGVIGDNGYDKNSEFIVTAISFKDSNGNFSRLFNLNKINGITKNEVEKIVNEMKEYLKNNPGATPDMICLADSQGLDIYLNPEKIYDQVVGYTSYDNIIDNKSLNSGGNSYGI